MRFVKISLLISAITIFVFACTSSSTNTNTTNTTANKPAANNNSVTNALSNATTNTQPTAANDELASARKIYNDRCIRCHKEGGLGGETDIEGTKIKTPNFTSDRQKKEPDSEYIDAITNGISDEGMPAFKGKLTDQEIKSLVQMIRKDFQKQ